MTTQNKQYEKPSMEVFELQQQQQLLAGSTGQGGFSRNPEEEEMS